jgi:hypothetical protein
MTDNKAMAGRLADYFLNHSRDAIRDAAKEALHREPTAAELALTSAGFVMGAGAAAQHLLEKIELMNVAKN